MKILNLYAGIGGNRKLWGDEHEITAVELDENIAKIYKELYSNDTVIIGDAHEFLKEHFLHSLTFPIFLIKIGTISPHLHWQFHIE